MFGCFNTTADRKEYDLEETVYVPSINKGNFSWSVGWVIGVTTAGPQAEVEYKITHKPNETVEGYWIPAELVYNKTDYMETFH